MTADAASQHGHEFSTPRGTTSTLARLPMATLNAFLSVTTGKAFMAPKSPRIDNSEGSGDKANSATDDPLQRRLSSSSSTGSMAETKSRRRSLRPKTTYNLCHPPPTARQKQKLHLRPKVLLQLHQVSQKSRPRPAFEVTPAYRCAPKLLSNFSRALHAIDKLGADDVVVLRAADYGLHDEGVEVDTSHEARDEAIGVICVQTKKEDKQSHIVTTDIWMDDCSLWRASAMPQGGYEFVSTDAHGLQVKARWVARSATHRRKRSNSDTRSVTGEMAEEKKFTFSTIRPDHRRHPIIATMTRANIDVMNEYVMPSSPTTETSTGNSTPVATPYAGSESESYLEARNQPIKTDDALRKLILVTGIWVALRENWSTAFRYPTSITSTSGNAAEASNARPFPPQRAVSMPPLESKISTRSSTPEEGQRHAPKLLRTGSNLKRNSGGAHLPQSPTAPLSPVTPTASTKTRKRRSNSTNTAILHSSNGIHRLQEEMSVIESPDELQQSFDHITLETGLATPNRTGSVPTTLTGASEVSLETPAAENGRAAYTRSAYISPESTKGMWDSGDAESGRKSVRPRSIQVGPDGLNGKSEKHKPGKLRRIFSALRR